MRVEADVGGLLRFVPNSLVLSLARKELLDTLARLKNRLETDSAT